jgi:hypothetical protein
MLPPHFQSIVIKWLYSAALACIAALLVPRWQVHGLSGFTDYGGWDAQIACIPNWGDGSAELEIDPECEFANI